MFAASRLCGRLRVRDAVDRGRKEYPAAPWPAGSIRTAPSGSGGRERAGPPPNGVRHARGGEPEYGGTLAAAFRDCPFRPGQHIGEGALLLGAEKRVAAQLSTGEGRAGQAAE